MADLEKERGRGNDAAYILNHAIFKEAWNAAKESLENQRLKIGLRDTDMHTRLIMAEQILSTLKHYFEDVINTGKMAQIQLEKPSRFPLGMVKWHQG